MHPVRDARWSGTVVVFPFETEGYDIGIDPERGHFRPAMCFAFPRYSRIPHYSSLALGWQSTLAFFYARIG